MSTKKANGRNHSPDGADPIVDRVEAGRRAYMSGDFQAALSIWQPRAEAGDPVAQAWVGSLYANGDGVALDDAEALRWYVKAAEGGNAAAQANVGAFHALGRGTARDYVKAAEWLARAGDNGDVNGLFNLAVLYAKGEGVEKDAAKAASCYRRAAERGHYPSQARLGHIYAKGIGVERDAIEAYVWLSLAGQHGIGTALQELEEVMKSLSSDEKAEAMRRFEQWRSTTSPFLAIASLVVPPPMSTFMIVVRSLADFSTAPEP